MATRFYLGEWRFLSDSQINHLDEMTEEEIISEIEKEKALIDDNIKRAEIGLYSPWDFVQKWKGAAGVEDLPSIYWVTCFED